MISEQEQEKGEEKEEEYLLVSDLISSLLG